MKVLGWALMCLAVLVKLASFRFATDSKALFATLGFVALGLLVAGIVVYVIGMGLSGRAAAATVSAEPSEPKVGCAFGQAHIQHLELIAKGLAHNADLAVRNHVFGSGDPRDHGCDVCEEYVAQQRRDLIRAERQAFTGGPPT